MIEIKYRGKRIDNSEWVYGDLIHGQGSKHGKMYILPQTAIYPKGCNELDGWEVLPETVGQFIGLFDKNNREIYEGDIITNDGVYTRAIVWNSYECKFNAVEWGTHTAIILGNIHDNPELLTKE